LLILESSPRRTSTTIGELSEALGLAPSTMTELLDRAQAARVGEVLRSTRGSWTGTEPIEYVFA
jgi:DNA-binding MarR family transcriptional regulator